MERDAFVQLVHEAVQSIPERFRKKMDNVAFLVEDQARAAEYEEEEIVHRGTQLGLYQGIPLLHRVGNYHMVLPDRITIFQQPIEALAGQHPDRVRQIIMNTVLHEVAHHLGFSEADVRRWERSRRRPDN